MLTNLYVAAGGDEKTVVFGEVQVAQPASMERVHAVFPLSGANLQQGAVFGAPKLQNCQNYSWWCFHKDVKKIPNQHDDWIAHPSFQDPIQNIFHF